MATLPLATCARMLGIHPKTLHHWLTQANLPLSPHPTDARIKCVTEEQLLEVARLHGHPLLYLPSALLLDGLSVPGSHVEQAKPLSPNEAGPTRPGSSMPATSALEVDLIQKLSCLETKVVTLQEQLAQLALALLQERERSLEQRISVLETVTAELVGTPVFSTPLPDPQIIGTGPERACTSRQKRQLNPAEQLARSRMPPLIEYGAQGSYVIVSSQEGELNLVPDSTEWFDWLATLSSFRFVGRGGRFTAYRETRRSGPTRGWTAHRCIRQHRYKHYIGVTDRLTLASLEQMAAQFQAHMDLF